VCTTKGSAILFENVGEGKYPVYVRDSLLNTNENFDFGAFDALGESLIGGNYSSFVFTFYEAGVYVFADSRNQAKQMIIAVMADARKCPEDTAFSPQLYSSLLKVGAFKEDVLEPPNWYLFFGTLLVAGLLIFITVVIVAYISKKDWRQRFLPKIFYQGSNYTQVKRSDPKDKRAIVSINTELSSFLYRHTGEDGDDAELDDQTGPKKTAAQALKEQKKKKKNKKKKDLSLNEVEDLKSNL